jgi:hypothetical protein
MIIFSFSPSTALVSVVIITFLFLLFNYSVCDFSSHFAFFVRRRAARAIPLCGRGIGGALKMASRSGREAPREREERKASAVASRSERRGETIDRTEEAKG